MRRSLASLFIAAMLLALNPMGAAAEEHDVDLALAAFLLAILGPDHADSQEMIAITEGGATIVLGQGHTPIKDGVFLIDFSGARGAIDDSDDGADSRLDITRAWGNRVHLSDAASEYLTQGNGGFSLPPGFFSAHDGTPPAFPPESVVVGVETAEPITEETDPPSFRIRLKIQLSLGFTLPDIPVYESDDSNGGHNATRDVWSNGFAGTDAFSILDRSFTQERTGFFGRARGNQLFMGGPWSELDGATGFVANTVIYPDFDPAALGDLGDFGLVTAYRFSEMDTNDNGVIDSLEGAETTSDEETSEEVEEPVTEDPADAPQPEEPATSTDDTDSAAPVAISVETESGGGNAWLFILIGLVVFGGGFGLWMVLKRREKEKCEPEAAALASANAKVAEKESAVETARAAADQAREHLEYTEANASEQRELRLVEAGQAVAAAESEVTLEEGRLSDARAERDAARYTYDVCMGFVTPEPEPEPEPEVTAPVVPPPTPVPPTTEGTDTGQPGVIDSGTDEAGATGGSISTPPPPPPPPKKPECEDGQTREIEEGTGSFTIPVDETVRFSLTTGDGPLDDLEDIVSGTSIADMITDQVAELLTPDSLSVSASSLSAGSARSWQSSLEKMAGAARTEIEVVIEYDLEEVSLACIRLEECQSGHWVTVGYRLEERGRTQRTVTAHWETVSSSRPLGATFTSVRRGLEKASASKAEMEKFSSSCK